MKELDIEDLRENATDLANASEMIYWYTGEVVKLKHVDTQIKRMGNFSLWQRIGLKLLSKVLELKKELHDMEARLDQPK